MYKILNYGKHYTNYSTYNVIENDDNLETIYIDNQPCFDVNKIATLKNDIKSITTNNANDIVHLLHYVELHYTKNSNKKIFETILTNHEIDTLLEKYGNKV